MKAWHLLLWLVLLALIGSALYVVNQKQSMGKREKQSTMTLTSSVFEHGGKIPSKYTCDGENLSPPLTISGIPEGAQSLVLIMDDPDIPQVFKEQRGIDSFDHLVAYNIPTNTIEVGEGNLIGEVGFNGKGEKAYTGPCPPTEYKPTEHRYFFKLYALSGALSFEHVPTKAEVEQAMSDIILEQAELVGLYDRANKQN